MGYKRWSKVYIEGEVIEHISPNIDSKCLYRVSLKDISTLAEDLKYAAENMRKSNFDSKSCEQACHIFWEFDWDLVYGEPEEGLYAGKAHFKEIYDNLDKLTYLGYDVRPLWRKFRDLLSDIWRNLPHYYKGAAIYNNERGHPNWNIDMPEDYDPNKPFPNLYIPEDIDLDTRVI